MNKSASIELPSFTGEMIGVLIVLGLLMMIFVSFSEPTLAYLADYEAIKSFNRFTGAISGTCREGTDTISYVNFPAHRDPIVIALFNQNFVNNITNLDECSDSGEGVTCTDRSSKSRVQRCRESHYQFCLCLLRLKLVEGNTLNEDFDIIQGGTLPENPEQIYDIVNFEINSLLNILDLHGDNNISKIEVIQCRSFEDLCMYEDENGHTYPVLPNVYEEGLLLWMHTKGRGQFHSSLYFTSMSLNRVILGGEYSYYMDLYTSPEKEVSRLSINEIVVHSYIPN